MTLHQIPQAVVYVCGVSCGFSLVISITGILLQLVNYRKPFEQRLITRILLVVPMFAVSCYMMLADPQIGELLDPIREIYEAFVIYTFYKLLVLMCGGERSIIQKNQDTPPTSHFFPTSLFLSPINISDPHDFLTIKRCILQYVWMKFLLYIVICVSSLLGCYDVNDVSFTSVYFWVGLFYNISVTISLYYLALFWKCLYDELSRFNPWPKFLCVKVIIFASYWQGLFIAVLNYFGLIPREENTDAATNFGIQIQNALLCLEMVFFAWLHWTSFPYTDFTADKFPTAARFTTWAAIKDWASIADLWHDLKITTMYGDSYNFRNFDRASDSNIYNKSATFDKKIYQGLRISSDGKKHWIPIKNSSPAKSDRSVEQSPLLGSPKKKYMGRLSAYEADDKSDSDIPAEASEDDFANVDLAKDEKIYNYVRKHYISSKTLNCPTTFDYYKDHDDRVSRMRQQRASGIPPSTPPQRPIDSLPEQSTPV